MTHPFSCEEPGCVALRSLSGLCEMHYWKREAERLQAVVDEGRTESRPHYLPPAQYRTLERCAAHVNAAFDGFGCYLVGSSTHRRDYRDVDVRYILGDAEFDRLFPTTKTGDAFWSFLCGAVADWMRDETGLPVDFQTQRQTDANLDHAGTRSFLGGVTFYPGELPSRLSLRRARRSLLTTLSSAAARQPLSLTRETVLNLTPRAATPPPTLAPPIDVAVEKEGKR